MTTSLDDVRKLISEELSKTLNAGQGVYVFVPHNNLVSGSNSRLHRRSRRVEYIRHSPGTTNSGIGEAEVNESAIASSDTFEKVAREWFGNNENRWVQSYLVRKKSRMESDLIPALGKLPIAEIEPLDVLDAVRAVEDRGAIESAERILHMASSVFRYAVATGRCFSDPTVDLKDALKPANPPKRRAALPVKDLSGFMNALEQYDGDIITQLALKLVVYTFVRTGELRFAKWSEFEGLGGTAPLWRISAERMKMRRPHIIPLAPQAVSLLDQLKRYTGRHPFVFPANTKFGVISENTLLFALYRMGYHGRATIHGFRSTASTVLNEAQFNRGWIELQLAHNDGTIRGVYNAAEWLPGRRKMMVWWADFLEGKVSPPQE